MRYSSSQVKFNYRGLDQVLNLIHYKIKESLPFAREYVPNYIHSAEDLFYFLKSKLIYKSDPKGIELLQSFPALMLDNYHGIAGAGDCDCFVIAGAASLHSIGIPYTIELAGNGKNPTHIYLAVHGKCFDLTRPKFGQCPKYKHYWTA